MLPNVKETKQILPAMHLYTPLQVSCLSPQAFHTANNKLYFNGNMINVAVF